jgi:VIT1/CCC1 family predicted Fe2+/Mn2+ transporter
VKDFHPSLTSSFVAHIHQRLSVGRRRRVRLGVHDEVVDDRSAVRGLVADEALVPAAHESPVEKQADLGLDGSG